MSLKTIYYRRLTPSQINNYKYKPREWAIMSI